MIRQPRLRYAPHLTNTRLPDYTGTLFVHHVFFLELAHCGTIFFKHNDFFTEFSAVKILDCLVMLAKVEVLDGADF